MTWLVSVTARAGASELVLVVVVGHEPHAAAGVSRDFLTPCAEPASVEFKTREVSRAMTPSAPGRTFYGTDEVDDHER